MEEAKFSESEIAYVLHILGNYYHIEEIRKVMRLLSARFTEKKVWNIKTIWKHLTGSR